MHTLQYWKYLSFLIYFQQLHKEVFGLTYWYWRGEIASRIWEAQGWESPSQEDCRGVEERGKKYDCF